MLHNAVSLSSSDHVPHRSAFRRSGRRRNIERCAGEVGRRVLGWAPILRQPSRRNRERRLREDRASILAAVRGRRKSLSLVDAADGIAVSILGGHPKSLQEVVVEQDATCRHSFNPRRPSQAAASTINAAYRRSPTGFNPRRPSQAAARSSSAPLGQQY